MASQKNAWMSPGKYAPGGRYRPEGPRVLQNQPEPCIPAVISTTFTSTTDIPANCLPIPAGATIDCRQLAATGCATGTPEVAGPTLIEVPVTIGVAPNTVIIRDATGAVICTIDVPQPGPITTVVPVTCPVTTGVTCTCTATIGACLDCTFNADRTATVCTHELNLVVTCAALPAPTEIVCIRTEKVYDFCFEQEIGLQNCVPIPANCGTPPAGSTAECTITDITCVAGPPVPIPGQDGFSTVRKTIVITYTVVIRNAAGTVVCTIPNNQFTFTRSVVLCAPVGTTTDCQAFATCGNCVILLPTDDLVGVEQVTEPTVCCEFNLCVVGEAHAFVKLLVPAFGFCTPAPCRTGGFPPFVCPPPLFPPQCPPLV